MRRGSRTRNQRLDSAETGRVDRYRHALDKTSSRVETAFEFKTQHAAESVEQFVGAQMVRMTFQPRIVDPAYRTMLFHPARDLERTFVLMAHAHRERLHPAMKQEACVRIENPAQMVQRMRYAFDKLRAPDHRAGDDIGVSVEILGAAMFRQIEADF